MRLAGGMLLGALLSALAVLGWTRREPCLDRCGAGTRCVEARCLPVEKAAVAPVPVAKKRRPREGLGAAAPEVRLQPGDDKVIAQGDALGRPERIDLSEPDARELSEDELDGVFRGAHSAIERCITDALGDAPLEAAKIEVGLRVERSGSVSRVRVEGPTLLQRRGLYRCVRPIVGGLQFPASGGASVVSYPFELK
jgi:hypothetical protein